MRPYTIIQALDSGFALTVFWIYVGAFVLTFALVFVMPPAAIVLLFLALFGLIGLVASKKLLHAVVATWARVRLVRGRCPRCSGPAAAHDDGPLGWTCSACGAPFLADGAEPTEAELAQFADPAS